MASRPKARKGGAGKRAACSAEPSSPPTLSALQPDILHQVLTWLPQTQRCEAAGPARSVLCCCPGIPSGRDLRACFPPTRLGPRPLPLLPPPYLPHPALPTRTPLFCPRRVHAGQVCCAWREATLSPALWSHLYFRLPRDDDEETAEAFVSWLLPRVGQVETLHIDIQDVAQVGGGQIGLDVCRRDGQFRQQVEALHINV